MAQPSPWDAVSSPIAEPSGSGSAWDALSSPIVETPGVSFASDGSPAGLRNVPTAPTDPTYHGAVPTAQAPDQGASTAFGSGVGGVPIFGPMIEGGLQRAAALGRSMAGGGTYDAELAHVQDMTNIARQQHPYAAFAGDLTGAASAMAPVIAAAPEVFGAGGGGLTGGKMVAGGLSGAAVGGADAGVRSGSDPTSVMRGVEAGAAGGAAGPVIGAGLGRAGQGLADLYSRFASPSTGLSRPAAKILTDTITNDGQMGPQGLANIGAAGPHGMLVDASPSLSGVLDGALQHGGPGASAARQAIEARATGANADMTSALDRAFGPPQGVQTATDALRNDSAAARGAAYDTAYGTPIDYTSGPGQALEAMVRGRVPPGIVARANAQMRMDGTPSQQIMMRQQPDGSYTLEQMPDVRQIDYITRSLQDVSRAGDGQGALGGNTSEGRSYGMLAQDLRGALRQAVPEFGDALDTAAQPIQARNALDFGASMLHPSVPRDAVAGTLQGMTGPELAQVKGGMRAHFADTLANVQRTVTDPNVDARQATAAVKMLSSDAASDKLSMLLGPNEAQGIATALDRAGRSLDLRASVSRNSATAARQSANQVVTQAAQPSLWSRMLTSGGPMKATRPLFEYMTGNRPEDIAARATGMQGELATALTSPAPGSGGGILDALLRGSQVQGRANSIAGAIPYGGGVQTGIFSLLPALNHGAYQP